MMHKIEYSRKINFEKLFICIYMTFTGQWKTTASLPAVLLSECYLGQVAIESKSKRSLCTSVYENLIYSVESGPIK